MSEQGEPPSIEVQFTDQGYFVPSLEQIQEWATSALQEEASGLTIRIVDTEEIQALNKDYRDKNKPTNVLSFPSEIPPELGLAYCGDIAICAQIVSEEAQEQQKPILAHWMHMVIHGVLHLRGYDHIEPEEAQEMETLEIHLLKQLNIENPYETTFQAGN